MKIITHLVNVEDAAERIASGAQLYAFQISDDTTILGPACRFGTDYLNRLRVKGGYAESIEEATLVVHARGATVTGVWLVKG